MEDKESVKRANQRKANKRYLDRLKQEDPLRYKANNLRQTLRNRGNGVAPSASEIYEWLQTQDFVCAYSGDQMTKDSFTVDHRQPLHRGGTNDFDNLCLCTKAMNLAKGTMTEAEFRSLMAFVGQWDDGGKALFARLRMAGSGFGR